MGGDGLGGLAFAILALMAMMLVGLALGFGAIGLFSQAGRLARRAARGVGRGARACRDGGRLAVGERDIL